MAEPTIYLRDKHGPFAGQVVAYRKSAGENAIANGFAEYVTPEPVAEVQVANPPAAIPPVARKKGKRGA